MPHQPWPVDGRFWGRVQKTEGCWLWTGSTTRGYGTICVNGANQYAHRVAYELLVGPIPAGMELDHLCFVRSCVNPAHLEPVTTAENVRRELARIDWSKRNYRNQNSGKTHCIHGHPFDESNTIWEGKGRHCRACMRERGRQRDARRRKGTGPAKGEDNNKAKLTAEHVRAIRRRYAEAEPVCDLATEFGIARSYVWAIVTRKTWKHID